LSPRRIVVANGTVSADYGVFAAHVVIEDGRVAALTRDESVLASADEVVDASGLFVLPGAIDPHAHFEDPGHTEREDFTTGTMAAAAGGFTTVFEHPLTYPPVTTTELYREKREMARGKAVVDFGLWGALTEPSLAHMRRQWDEGALGFKAFMPFSEPAYPNVDDAQFLEGMGIAAELDALVLVHAENDAMVRAGIDRMQREGRTDPLAHHESRPPIVEEEAVQRAIFLAGHAGCRLQVVHVSSPGSAELVKRAKAAGRAVSMETCPHHLLLDLDDLVRLGPYGRCAPALRERALVERLWDSVLDGTADSLVSDHCAYTLVEKEAGWENIFAAPNGCQVMQETVATVFDEAVHRRGMGLDAFARFSATNAARRIGIYPRKGTVLPGSDADLALWDLDGEWAVDARSQQFSKNPWSPFEGRRLRARPVRTLVRGETVYVNGEIAVAPGHGRFLSSQDDYAIVPARAEQAAIL
jgi:allantoinase